MILGNRPGSGETNGYDAIEEVFGGETFSQEQAVATLEQALGMPKGEAQTAVSALISKGCIIDVYNG